jgi:HD superfamily phosphohydrolase YqeK
LLERSGFAIDERTKELPMLAHGAAAAAYLTENGVALPYSVMAAICDHTFPDNDAPLFTRILAVADTLEPSRNVAENDLLRNSGLPFDEMFAGVLRIKAHRSRQRRVNNQVR